MTHNLIIAAVGAGIVLLRVSFAMREKLIGKPMKYLLLIVTMLSCIPQVPEALHSPPMPISELPFEIINNFDKMGVDSSLYLNSYECAYFNEIFKKVKKDFDFSNKKIGFIESERFSNKKRFFITENSCRLRYGEKIGCCLYVFLLDEKEHTGGFNAAISFSNVLPVEKQKIIEILIKSKK